MMGFGFGPGSRGVGGFRLATKSLTAWFEDWSASPWNGLASAGTSGSNTASEATNPPATFAVNGHNAADFDGTNDTLTLSGANMDVYFNNDAAFGWLLVNSDAAQTRHLIADSGNVGFRVTINSTTTAFLNLNNGGVSVSRTFADTTWQLITFGYDKVNAKIGVNEAPGAAGGGSTAAYSTNLNLSNVPRLAFNGTTFFNGKIASIGLADNDLYADPNFITNLKSYLNNKFALSL